MTENKNQEHVDQSITKEYTSTRGVKAIFRPMPPLLHGQILKKMAADDWLEPETPTYKIETFGGDEEIHEHDKTTIRDYPEDQVVWDEYEKKLEEHEAEFNRRFQQACRITCMEMPDLDSPEWQEAQEFLGYDIPDGRIERKLHYIETEFIGGSPDIIAIVQIPMELALRRSDTLTRTAELFRDRDVEGENTSERTGPDSGEEVGMVEGSAAGGSPVAEDADSQRMGDET